VREVFPHTAHRSGSRGACAGSLERKFPSRRARHFRCDARVAAASSARWSPRTFPLGRLACAMPSCLPPPDASRKSGPFPALRSALTAVIGTMTPADALSVPAHFALAYRAGPPAGTRSRFHGGGPPEFPAWPCQHPAPFTPGGSSPLHLQGLHGFHGLRPDHRGSAPPCPPRGGCFHEAAGFRHHAYGLLTRSPPKTALSRRFGAGVSPARRPPATRPPGHYLGRTSTGWSRGTSLGTHDPKRGIFRRPHPRPR
jgi:hypothetical protein